MATRTYGLKLKLNRCVEALWEDDTLKGELEFNDFLSDADPLDYHLLERLPDEAVLILECLFQISQNERAVGVLSTELNQRGLESEFV